MTLTSLQIGILERLRDERYIMEDSYVESVRSQLTGLATRGLAEKLYTPLGKIAYRITPEGRKRLKS